MKILEIHLIEGNQLDGPALEFHWEPLMRETLEQTRNMANIGDGIATFGEQIRVNALEKAAMAPGRILGPDGVWIA